jgi:predicted flap endonuclease-1-like 5' DNA nuclease
MGKLADETTRLSDDIRSLRQNRHELLVQTQQSVRELGEEAKSAIESARAARKKMARESGSGREHFLKDLRADVQRIRLEAQDLCDRFRQDFAERAESARSNREAFVEDLKGRVESLRTETQRLRARLCQDRSAATEQSRREMEEFLSELQCYAKELCDAFREAREEMAETSGGERAAFVSQIAEGVASLREQVASELKTTRAAIFGPAPAQLKAEQERRRAERERRAKEKTRRERAEAARARQHPDDLTVISGIGPKTQERLNEKGIWTYAQLAGKDPERLCRTFEELPSATLENVRRWVAEARKLARQ